jgi:PKD repeat protein
MGIYNVTLTVNVADDRGYTSNDSVTVKFAITTSLCAKIVMPRGATVGDVVTIKGNRSFTFSAPHGRTLANWTWDFGDGSSAYTQNVTHAWSSAGIFTVNLFVKDNLGLQSLNATAKIVIATAAVSGIGLSLVRHSLLPGESTTLTIKAVNDAGKVVTSFNGNVVLVANGSGWTLPSPVALVNGVKTVIVSCVTPGSYNISVAVQGTPSQNGSIFVTVNNRTVEIRIYGIFEPGLPDYWLKRSQIYNLADEGFRNYTPSIEIYRVGTITAGQLSTTYVMNVEARNIHEINMSSPTFAHLRNPTTGKGNVTIAIDYYMMTQAQILAADGIYFPAGKAASWDGWEYLLSYNATMDRAAAEQIIGLPSASWSDQTTLNAWWVTNNLTVSRNWERAYYPTVASPGFLGREGGYGGYTGRLDLRACEDNYNYGQGYWGSVYMLRYIDANHVSFFSYNVGYGLDALVARWLYWGGIGSGANYPNGTPNGIVPFEPWYDNMSLRVSISDDHANVSMYAVVVYGFRAWTSDVAPEGTATFRWEVIRLDYVIPAVPPSELKIYYPYGNDSDPQYVLRDPGSSLWGETTKYDYVPAVITLKPGESIFMQAPRVMAVGYLPEKMIGDYTDGSNYWGGYYDFLKILEVFGNATIHPVGCYPGTYTLDKETSDMTIVGPFVPIVVYRSDITWLVYEPAPRIELWIQ